MNKYLTSLFFVFFTLCFTIAQATVEDAKDLALEQIKVLNAHMMHCEEEGYNHGLVMDYQYHNGYVHGARDAYEAMLSKINKN